MHLGHAWRYYGADSQVAAALGISRQAVSKWRNWNGGRIPYERQLELEALTDGALVADPIGQESTIPRDWTSMAIRPVPSRRR